MKMEKVELRVSRVYAANKGQDTFYIELAEKESGEVFNIEIGHFEARAILMAFKEVRPARPMTHDLFAGILGALGVRLLRVIIYKVEKGVYHSYLYLQAGNAILRADARTSDAVALVCRMGAPIYTYKSLLRDVLSGKDTSSGNENGPDGEDGEEFIPMESSRMDSLKKALQAAIENEDYEKAAQLRDEINKNQ